MDQIIVEEQSSRFVFSLLLMVSYEVLLPGKSHGWRSLEGCSPWDRWGSDTTEWLHFHFSLSCFGEGNGNILQYCCLENPTERGNLWAMVHRFAKSWTWLKWLSTSTAWSRVSVALLRQEGRGWYTIFKVWYVLWEKTEYIEILLHKAN